MLTPHVHLHRHRSLVIKSTLSCRLLGLPREELAHLPVCVAHVIKVRICVPGGEAQGLSSLPEALSAHSLNSMAGHC